MGITHASVSSEETTQQLAAGRPWLVIKGVVLRVFHFLLWAFKRREVGELSLSLEGMWREGVGSSELATFGEDGQQSCSSPSEF